MLSLPPGGYLRTRGDDADQVRERDRLSSLRTLALREHALEMLNCFDHC